MKMTFKAFAKNLFGAKYERLQRNIFIYLIVFWGLYITDWKVQIAPFIRYLMSGTFTAGVMWQALCSEDHASKMQNMFMLPFDNRKFVLSYIAALGSYTILTKTAALIAVLLAVSKWKPMELLGCAVCVVNGVLMSAAVYSLKKYWYADILWAGVIVAGVLLFANEVWLTPLLTVNSIFAAIRLLTTDGYIFYSQEGRKSHRVKQHRHFSVWRYLFRYLGSHKNYLVNTAVMWCVALVLPYFLGQMDGLFVVPIGFAILTLNTPICILLSCDPDLEQAIRFLPDQKRAFGIPYCLFIFSCNMAADTIFLCSWLMKNGSVTVWMILTAVFFALQSAILSVLLEWFYPVRGWKIESDLWHHPRKYAVPAIMLLAAGMIGTFPVLMPGLMLLLAVEVVLCLLNLSPCRGTKSD